MKRLSNPEASLRAPTALSPPPLPVHWELSCSIPTPDGPKDSKEFHGEGICAFLVRGCRQLHDVNNTCLTLDVC